MLKALVGLTIPFVLATASAEERVDPHHVYRLDFVVSEGEVGKAPVSTAYTLNLEEHRTGEIKVGTNVPLAGQRADVGVTVRASYTRIGDDLLIDDEVEIIAMKDAQSVRKMFTKGNTVVTEGKAALIASVDDAVNRKHYQVTVKPTRLR